MGVPDASGDLSSEMEVDAFRHLFPLRYFERHLSESIRPDARPLGRARDTTLALGWLSIVLVLLSLIFMFLARYCSCNLDD
jgi:hypothetical protein